MFSGAVLTGGASRRMGEDKALLKVEGVALALRVSQALSSAGADPVVCVGGDEGSLTKLGLIVIPDQYPGMGPLGGTLTALNSAQNVELIVILAVDLPYANPMVIRQVVSAMRPGVDVVVPVQHDQRQWLHGCWRIETVLPVLAKAFNGGERSLKGAVKDLTILEIDGLDSDSLTDADRPEDLP